MSATFGAMLPEARASRVDQDGALRKIPGNTAGEYPGDQPFFWVDFGNIDMASAGSAGRNNVMVPFDAYIAAVVYNVDDAPDAAVSLDIGDQDGANTYADLTVASGASGVIEHVEDADFDTLTTRNVDKGDILAVATDGNSTASATAKVAILLVPRVS